MAERTRRGRSAALAAIILFFGLGVGFVIGANSDADLGGHDHNNPNDHAVSSSATNAHSAGTHDQKVQAEQPLPDVSVALIPDGPGAWNMRLDVDNFVFTPEMADQHHVAGTGHAHVFINGLKLARVYGPWFHLGALPAGTEVSVTLNSNDHRAFAVEDNVIQSMAVVPEE
jgi:hypothetical protein